MVFRSQSFTDPITPMGLRAAQEHWLCLDIDWYKQINTGNSSRNYATTANDIVSNTYI